MSEEDFGAEPPAKRQRTSLELPVCDGIAEDILIRDVCRLVPDVRPSSRGNSRRPPKLPGPLPATLNRAHLNYTFRAHKYWVAEKSDGVRHMLLFQPQRNAAYLVDRAWKTQRLSMKLIEVLHSVLGGDGETLLDGELLSSGFYDQEPVFLFYDIPFLNGSGEIAKKSFTERYERMKELGNLLLRAFAQDDRGLFGIRLQSKMFAPHTELERITRKLEIVDGKYLYHDPARKRKNYNDGLVFIADEEGFISRNKDALLKWKYVEKNTIDFKIKQDKLTPEVELFAGGYGNSDLMVRRQQISSEELKRIRDDFDRLRCRELVYECQYDPQSSRWQILHLREDKTDPNFISVVFSTLETMVDNITVDNLKVVCRELFHEEQKKKK
eukprot:TRINITY_DN32845_c0_g1_i1.p1 TRINITY_DN32845_c0_g1~~TRINITY_DN32845_c0_g1_i1.p1  ORF type:complete len:390 (-),score=85.24 TRINITY_DN32845_c0_g1_i1:144-1292(-)